MKVTFKAIEGHLKDASKFFLLRKHLEEHIDFDMDSKGIINIYNVDEYQLCQIIEYIIREELVIADENGEILINL